MSSHRITLWALLAGGCAAAALAVTTSGGATSGAACTAPQKTARTATAAAYRKKMPAERTAYFKRVKSARLRAAFVKRQQAKLKSLQSAAACTVPSLPPSTNASCDFMFPPLERYGEPGPPGYGPYAPNGQAILHEGPLSSDFLPSTGQVKAVELFIDFPDAPASTNTTALAPLYTSAFGWFSEVSYGRFSVAATPIHRWIRMPKPSTEYGSPQIYSPEDQREVFADAIAAADPHVDFSQYQSVLLVFSTWLKGNKPFKASRGDGISADGALIRYGTTVNSDLLLRGPQLPARVQIHEFLHTLGLPDLIGPTVGAWDMMADDGGAATRHLLGWHKWRLRWLDPPQLTCLHEAGQLEETLTPIATAGGKKLVVVPVSPRKVYAIEVRRRLGYDSTICKEGVLVYTVDQEPELISTVRQVTVLGPRTCFVNTGAFAAPFEVGGVYEDEAVKVEVLATDGKAYRIRVTKK